MSILISLLLYAGFGVFVIGCLYWIWQYATTPAPLKNPTMPAPISYAGVVLRLLRETLLFESLFKASKWTWLLGWVFHASFTYIVVCHLQFFLNPVWGWVAAITRFSTVAGILLFASLTGLLIRRILVARVRYISNPSDYLMLLLLLCLAGTGLLMSNKFYIDLYTLQIFAQGLQGLSFNELPSSALLVLHLLMVSILLLIFPFSKLIHAIGVFFSPSRNQRDNSRLKRHINRWGS